MINYEAAIKRAIEDLEIFCNEIYGRDKDTYQRIFRENGIDII